MFLFRKQFCLNKYCNGLFDGDLKLCYKTFCAKNALDDALSDCILEKCGTHVGFFKKVCIFENCRKNQGSKTSQVWSDEPTASKPGYDDAPNLEELWFADYEQISENGNLGETGKSSEEMSGCEARCKSQERAADEDYESCLMANCKTNAKRSSVSKRWSTRMCMESHCKSASNKVQYFLCGKEHCHK